MITVRDKPFKVVGVGADRANLKLTLSKTLAQAGLVKAGAKYFVHFERKGKKRIIRLVPVASGLADGKFGPLTVEFQVRGTFAGIAVPSMVRDTVGLKAGDRYVVQFDDISESIVITIE